MNKICEEIKKEMAHCDMEMQKAHEEMIRLQERLNLFSDRRSMLFGLLEIMNDDVKNGKDFLKE